jgi:hypothetical protein
MSKPPEISNRQLTYKEQTLGRLAHSVVQSGGGSLSFTEYDAEMAKEIYFAPFHWCAGLGLGKKAWRANNDKLCAFAACRMGLLKKTATGYEVVKKRRGR